MTDLTDKYGPLGPHALTYTGRCWYYLNPRSEDICLEDIAHALSNEPRFGGVTEYPWTVCQHLIMAYYMTNHLESAERRTIFGHDFPEAYCRDMIRPFRAICPDYNEHYQRTEKMVFEQFRFGPMTPELAEIDDRLMITEAVLLMRKDLPDEVKWWNNKVRYPFPSYMQGTEAELNTYSSNYSSVFNMNCIQAKAQFLAICEELDIH